MSLTKNIRERMESLVQGTFGYPPFVLEQGRFSKIDPSFQGLESVYESTVERSFEITVGAGKETPEYPVNQLDGFGLYEHEITIKIGYLLTNQGNPETEGLNNQQGAGSLEEIQDRANTDMNNIVQVLCWEENYSSLNPEVVRVAKDENPAVYAASTGKLIVLKKLSALLQIAIPGDYQSNNPTIPAEPVAPAPIPAFPEGAIFRVDPSIYALGDIRRLQDLTGKTGDALAYSPNAEQITSPSTAVPQIVEKAGRKWVQGVRDSDPSSRLPCFITPLLLDLEGKSEITIVCRFQSDIGLSERGAQILCEMQDNVASGNFFGLILGDVSPSWSIVMVANPPDSGSGYYNIKITDLDSGLWQTPGGVLLTVRYSRSTGGSGLRHSAREEGSEINLINSAYVSTLLEPFQVSTLTLMNRQNGAYPAERLGTFTLFNRWLSDGECQVVEEYYT